jgi:Mg2+ and Co2+ transporter CorA
MLSVEPISLESPVPATESPHETTIAPHAMPTSQRFAKKGTCSSYRGVVPSANVLGSHVHDLSAWHLDCTVLRDAMSPRVASITIASRPPRAPRALSEPVMGFFAILALAFALASVLFALPPSVDRALDYLQWAIIGLFAAEYVFALRRADDKRAFLFSPWRIVDVVIILGPFASLAAPTWDAALATPVLRLARVALFFLRLGGLAVREAQLPARDAENASVVISVLRAAGPPRPARWQEVTQRLVQPPADEWFHASGLDRDHVAEIARDAGIAPTFLAQALEETAFPRVEVYDRFSALFTWIPSLVETEQGAARDAKVQRNGVLLLATDHGVLTVAQRAIALQEDLVASMDDMALPPGTFTQRTILGYLKLVLRRYEAVAGHFEREARALELVPVGDSRNVFLERSFRVQREVSALKSDLWRLKGIIEAVADHRLEFHGLTLAQTKEGESVPVAEYMRVLSDEASYTYETALNTREGLLALIDLHINVVSFELNRVMRVLAVLSGLGLIPAIAGGLLGMNVAGNPWPVTLAQVSFGVTTAMVLALYVFAAKGWLR